MGCDIHSFAVDKSGNKLEGSWADQCEPFGARSYSIFGFLAGVRNYSGVPPISEPRGLPPDFIEGDDYIGDHSFSWLSVEELTNFDYSKTVEDRRYTRQVTPTFFDGGATCEPGFGVVKTWREFLGEDYFKDLKELELLGADRVVFGFDN